MMLTHKRATAAWLQPEEAAPLNVKGFRIKGVVLDKSYHVPLRIKDNSTCTLFSYGVDKIVTDINCGLDWEAAAAFPQVNLEDLKDAAGWVDILLGFNNFEIFPKEVARKDSLALWSFQLGTGWMNGVSAEHF
jgi:hypothetical protein